MIESDSNKLMWAAGAIVVAIMMILGVEFTFPNIFNAVENKIEVMLSVAKTSDTKLPDTDSPLRFLVDPRSKTADVVGFKNNDSTVADIPKTIIQDGVQYTITGIGNRAFANSKLVSVTIPNTVTNIEQQAFAYSKLTSIVIPNSVKTIGMEAFIGAHLTSLTLFESVTTIGVGAFANNELTSIIIPNSITTIGHTAFAGNKLTVVDVPHSVTSLGQYAFGDSARVIRH